MAIRIFARDGEAQVQTAHDVALEQENTDLRGRLQDAEADRDWLAGRLRDAEERVAVAERRYAAVAEGADGLLTRVLPTLPGAEPADDTKPVDALTYEEVSGELAVHPDDPMPGGGWQPVDGDTAGLPNRIEDTA
jgi:hypothetical protein